MIRKMLSLFVVLLPGIAMAAAAERDPLADATADLHARAAWTHGEIDRAGKVIAARPATSRPVLRHKDGRIAPDPRPTPAKALAAATALAEKVDAATKAALAALEPLKDDREKFTRQLAVARMQVNETVELVLVALAGAEIQSPHPVWLGAAPTPLDAVATKALDAALAEVVWAQWQIDHPDNVGGIGVVGAGGKESIQSFAAAQKIGTLTEVISPHVTFRVNPKVGAASVTPTTPNFTLQLLRPVTVDKLTLQEKGLLERRASTWWHRPAPPNMSAAAPATAPAGKAK